MKEMTKQAQRTACLTRRRALSREEWRAFSTDICRNLVELEILERAGVILSYRATEDEVGLDTFHSWAESRGKCLAFPVAYEQGRMEAWKPKDRDSWERGRYGIWVPAVSRSVLINPEEIEAVIVPCVGFDGYGGRLGHGGGYYDQYLPLCPRAARVLVAFEEQRLERVATGPEDQAVDMVVTQAGAFQIADRT